jgi:hypothetical protein
MIKIILSRTGQLYEPVLKILALISQGVEEREHYSGGDILRKSPGGCPFIPVFRPPWFPREPCSDFLCPGARVGLDIRSMVDINIAA